MFVCGSCNGTFYTDFPGGLSSGGLTAINGTPWRLSQLVFVPVRVEEGIARSSICQGCQQLLLVQVVVGGRHDYTGWEQANFPGH